MPYKSKSGGYNKPKSIVYSKVTRTKTTYNKSKPKSNVNAAYCYSLNLKGGKKYVGYTTNINKRIGDHVIGKGSKVTQKYKPISINHVQKCSNISNAKKAETIVYKNMAQYHGVHKVRGAGHTSSIKF
jgi:predicted GIY-YIG superfamily endonuclease